MGRAERQHAKRERGESEEETRRRITEAAVELHGTVGPAGTKLTRVAELAGVSRTTVHDHFPTDADLFRASSTRWASEHPTPDVASWRSVADPGERLRGALAELYRWYDANQDMMANILRDAPLVPAVGRIVDAWWGGYMDAAVDALSEGWPADGRVAGALQVTLRVVIDFHTWCILSASGLADDFAAGMVARDVEAIATR